jgi:hypothetical protein
MRKKYLRVQISETKTRKEEESFVDGKFWTQGCQTFLDTFFKWGKIYQTATNYQMAIRCTKGPTYIPLGLEYSNLFHSKALQIFPKLGFLV